MNVRRARKVLGLSAGHTAAELHAAYRSRIKSVHPDHAGESGEEAARETIEAYGVLAGTFGAGAMVAAQTRFGTQDENGRSVLGDAGDTAAQSVAGAYVPHGTDNPSLIQRAKVPAEFRRRTKIHKSLDKAIEKTAEHLEISRDAVVAILEQANQLPDGQSRYRW